MKTEIFKKAFKLVIGHEGGYSNDPLDKGKETKYGISSLYHPNVDIKNLTLDEAEDIYYKEYWDYKKLKLDRVTEYSPELAIELFDTAVNQGVVTAGKYLQEALNLANRNEKLYKDIKVDGWCGNKTFYCMEELSILDIKKILKIVNGLQFMKYYDIVKEDSEQEKWFMGWMNRV